MMMMKKYKYTLTIIALAILLFTMITLAGCKAEHTETDDQTAQVIEVPDALTTDYDTTEIDSDYSDLEDIDQDLDSLEDDFQ